MAMGETMIGVPWELAVVLAFFIVLAVTSWTRYQTVERMLLAISAVSLIFIPAALLLHPAPHAWLHALGGTDSSNLTFLMLSLAGNAMAPWMIYWQQNAVWAGRVRSLRSGRADILMGVSAQLGMATIVLIIGALTPAGGSPLINPIGWIAHQDGRIVGDLFALGIFNAGFLAACTISLSSAWMVRESWAPVRRPRHEMPTRGKFFSLHLLTLSTAALVALTMMMPTGTLALWAQALGALWMPVSLITLGLIARNRRTMGSMAMRWRRQLGLIAIILLFIGLAVATIISSW